MDVLITGYIPAEGRVSMVRVARSLAKALNELPELAGEVTLGETSGDTAASALNYRSWRVKYHKRLLLPWRLRGESCDILHIIDSDYAAGIPKSKLPRAVVTCHDLMPLLLADSIEEAFPGRLGRYFFRKSLERMVACARVVCDSTFTRDCVLRLTAAAPDRVDVAPIGVDQAFRDLPAESPEVLGFKQRYGLDKWPVLLHVGNAEPYKNLRTFLEAAAGVRAELPGGLHILKVGGRFTEEHKWQIERLGLAGSLVHLQGVSEEELVVAYNCADVLLWPSLFEGFGLPVLEAMACGTPVVCSNGGALVETAGEAAELFDPRDAEGMAQACLRIIHDRARASAMRERGVRHAAGFTWERTARVYHTVYNAIYSAL